MNFEVRELHHPPSTAGALQTVTSVIQTPQRSEFKWKQNWRFIHSRSLHLFSFNIINQIFASKVVVSRRESLLVSLALCCCCGSSFCCKLDRVLLLLDLIDNSLTICDDSDDGRVLDMGKSKHALEHRKYEQRTMWISKRLINNQSVINTVHYTNAWWLLASLMCTLLSTHRVEAKMIFIGKAAAAARGVIITAMITHRLLKNTWNVHSLRGQAAALQPSISHLQSIIIISYVVVVVAATAKRTLAAKYTGNLLLVFCMHLQNSSRCRDYSSMRTFRVWLETHPPHSGSSKCK